MQLVLKDTGHFARRKLLSIATAGFVGLRIIVAAAVYFPMMP